MNDPQPLPTDAERAEFERRMGGANFKRNAEGNYINEFVQCKWWGWCAHADAVRELGWQAARRTPATVWVEPAPSADGPKKPWLHLHVDCLPHEQSESVDYTSGDVAWRWHGIHDSDVRYVRADLAVEQALAMGRVPLSDQQIDQAIAELGLNYLANAHANNRAVLQKLCRHAHGIKGGQHDI